MKRLALTLALALAAAGCPAQPLDEAALRAKESALNKLAAALEAAVRNRGAPEGLTEEQLKALAWQEHSAQLEAFKDLLLRVRRQDKDSSVLVCTADGKRALWEDAGCTPPLEPRLFDRSPPVACDFQLDLAKTCR